MSIVYEYNFLKTILIVFTKDQGYILTWAVSEDKSPVTALRQNSE